MIIVQDGDSLDLAVTALNNEPIIALDTETNICDNMHERWVLGFSAYAPTVDESYYFPIRHIPFKDYTNVTKWSTLLKPQRIVYHNGKFDRQIFKKLEFNYDETPFEDTMLMSYVINEEPPHGLKELADKYIGSDSSNDQKIVKGLTKGFGWESMPMPIMAQYATTDTILTYRLYLVLRDILASTGEDQMQLYLNDLEFSLILQGIEEAGIMIDPVEARLKSAQCSELMLKIRNELGYDPAKPTQLGNRLYSPPPEGLGFRPISVGLTTKSFPNGRPKMGVAELEEHHHPEVGKVLEYRRVSKAKSSWYDAWPLLVDSNNRLHPSFHMHSTVTARLSCSNPNMQQIPRDSEENSTKSLFPVKKLIRCPKGYQVWEIDFSQQELRLASVYADEDAMLDIFRNNGDPHQLLADTLHVSRFIGKTCNFLLPYSGGIDELYMTVKKLAPSLGFTYKDAQKVYTDYHDKFPGFRRIAYECTATMDRVGYIKYWSKRRRHMTFNTHAAFNSLIQGGCADITKESIKRVNQLNLSDTKIISIVHDSIWIETKNLDDIELVKQAMTWDEKYFGVAFPVDAKRLA